MRTTLITFLGFAFTLSLQAQTLKDSRDTLSYSLGVLIGENLQQGGYEDINIDLFLHALQATLNNQPTILTVSACEQYIQEGANKMKMKQYEANRQAGEQFLEKNKARKEVVTLDNGLQYEILRAGDGPKPDLSDEVIVHYHGTLVDGTVFDSSVDRGESISFPLKGVIKGWTEILQLMPVGSKWRVYIPYQLAYGDRPAGPKIQPYSALIFEIDLLGIK